jgi:hypothetical protein
MLKNPLAREVAFAVSVKLIVIIAAGYFVFGSGKRPRIDAESVQARLMDPFYQSQPSRTLSP